MATQTVDSQGNKISDRGINYAGNPIQPGESYGGRPEWIDPDCPPVLGSKIKRKWPKVNQKQKGFAAGFWDKLKADPTALAAHLQKMKAGREKWMERRKSK